MPLVDRSEAETIEAVWAAFLADGIASKSGTNGAAGVDRDSSRNRVVVAASPARDDASTARIRLVRVDGDANSSSQLARDVDRGLGSLASRSRRTTESKVRRGRPVASSLVRS